MRRLQHLNYYYYLGAFQAQKPLKHEEFLNNKI